MADFEVIFMDAGQGDCTLIVYPDGSLTLVDCGSTKSTAEAFGPIKQILDRKFREGKDFTLVLTHPDLDHFNLLERVEVEKYINADVPAFVYYGGDISLYNKKGTYTYNLLQHLREHGIAEPPENTTSTEPHAVLSRAGVNVTILAANSSGNPLLSSKDGTNRNSIVLLVEYQKAKIFLMGDALKSTEQFIIDAFTRAGQLRRLKKQDDEHVVLKMGHHGSHTASSTEWIKLIDPEVIVVSSGTQTFGKYKLGMPRKAYLEQTIKASNLITTSINQSYVVFDEMKKGKKGEDFVTMPKTKQAIWTTCYEVNWTLMERWLESGQTWYYLVEKGKGFEGHWHGYTGYEDD